MAGDCIKTEKYLSAYLDGALEGKDRTEVEAHLGACSACAGELKLLAAVDAKLSSIPAIEPSPFFAARVLAGARAISQAGVSLRRFLRLPVPAMAIMVTVIMLNIFTFALNINAMESGTRREITDKIVAQFTKPASIINPVALVRFCDECSKYMCRCTHKAGKKCTCPCKNCEMAKEDAGKICDTETMEEADVH